jgi:hypothetical protein
MAVSGENVIESDTSLIYALSHIVEKAISARLDAGSIRWHIAG